MDLKAGDMVFVGNVPDPGLEFLSNKPGIITQVLNSPVRKVRGYIVKIAGLFMDENEWFIECKYVTKIDGADLDSMI